MSDTPPPATQDRPQKPDLRNVVNFAIILLLLLILLALTVRTLLPFASVFMWTVIMFAPAAPLSVRMAAALGGRYKLVASLIGAAYFLMLVVPLIYIGAVLDAAMSAAWDVINHIAIYGLPEPPPWLERLPAIGKALARLWRNDAHRVASMLIDSQSTLIVVGRLAVTQATDVLMATSEIIMAVVLTTVLLASGPASLIPLREFLSASGGDFAEVAVATAYRAILAVALGVVALAVLEAALATLGFAIAGLPQPELLGFLVFGCAVFQLSPLPICLPAALWLWWIDAPIWAGFMALWGVVVVNGVDMFGRPYLMSRTVQLPGFLLFFGVFGGLVAWGFSGMFIGAAAVAVAWTLMQSWVKARTVPSPLVANAAAKEPTLAYTRGRSGDIIDDDGSGVAAREGLGRPDYPR